MKVFVSPWQPSQSWFGSSLEELNHWHAEPFLPHDNSCALNCQQFSFHFNRLQNCANLWSAQTQIMPATA